MWLSHSSLRHGIRRKIIVACALGSLLLTTSGNPACAQDDARYTFEALHPEFLKTRIPDYAQLEIARSPAAYESGNGDFRVALAHGPAIAEEPERPAPLLWFAPLAPAIWSDGPAGVLDYMKLFTPSAPWPEAASHTDVFLVNDIVFLGELPGSPSDSQWRQVFADLNRRGIAFAISWGPLTPEGCGTNMEGFDGENGARIANKIKALGGTLKYIAMDEPFVGAIGCNWTPRQTAENALRSIARVRTVFPEVIVGDIEPIPAAQEPAEWLRRYSAWLDAWKDVSGAPFSFFHLDVNWSLDWVPHVEAMRRELEAHHVPFGMIYNG